MFNIAVPCTSVCVRFDTPNKNCHCHLLFLFCHYRDPATLKCTLWVYNIGKVVIVSLLRCSYTGTNKRVHLCRDSWSLQSSLRQRTVRSNQYGRRRRWTIEKYVWMERERRNCGELSDCGPGESLLRWLGSCSRWSSHQPLSCLVCVHWILSFGQYSPNLSFWFSCFSYLISQNMEFLTASHAALSSFRRRLKTHYFQSAYPAP